MISYDYTTIRGTRQLTYAVQAGCFGYNVVQTGWLIRNLGCSFDIHPPAFVLFPSISQSNDSPFSSYVLKLSLTYHVNARFV
jgi:hypothetical protein